MTNEELRAMALDLMLWEVYERLRGTCEEGKPN